MPTLILLTGIVHPPALRALADTTGFLIIGGVGVLFYAVEQRLDEGRPHL